MRHPTIFFIFLQLIFELSSSINLRVVPGSRLELPCLSLPTEFPGGSITWTFNGAPVSAESPGSFAIIKDGLFLSVSPVTASSNGKYVCMLKWDNMELSQTYTITVEAPVGFTIKAIEGSTVQLPCRFPSYIQTKTALWIKETGSGERVKLNPVDVANASDRLEWVFPFDNYWTIMLRNTVMKDAGIYQCETAEGEKFSTVHLIVDAAPTIPPHSCDGFTTPWEPCQDENSRTWEPMLQESIAEFSIKLYSHLRKLQPSTNLLFSPISISELLTYFLLGARDDTRRAIEAAICVAHDFHCVHHQMKKLRRKLGTSVQMASQIFYNPNMNLSKSFTNQSMQFYNSEPVKMLDNSDENTQMINSWVANKTNNKISRLVDFVPSHSQLILLNAVSFSGQWKLKFQSNPENQFFTKLNGDLVSVPVLYHLKYTVAMEYVAELMAKVVKFSLSGDSSLYILLPRSNKLSDLQMVEERMTDQRLHQMIQEMNTVALQPTEITIPKIKLNVQTDMNTLIKKLGLSSLFESPNLCGLYPEEKIVLTDARHKAFLALTEEGVEAGASTSMSFSRSYPSFSALRPFIMLLWSEQANVPLFIGRVTEP
ncbi:hypothetical protein LDENG_00271980 [Lucifuga dentata]|nr:hypothetical protein LDENG_00271980 [Lucifuga dentata]